MKYMGVTPPGWSEGGEGRLAGPHVVTKEGIRGQAVATGQEERWGYHGCRTWENLGAENIRLINRHKIRIFSTVKKISHARIKGRRNAPKFERAWRRRCIVPCPSPRDRRGRPRQRKRGETRGRVRMAATGGRRRACGIRCHESWKINAVANGWWGWTKSGNQRWKQSNFSRTLPSNQPSPIQTPDRSSLTRGKKMDAKAREKNTGCNRRLLLNKTPAVRVLK